MLDKGVNSAFIVMTITIFVTQHLSCWIKQVQHLTLQFIPIQFVMLKSFILSKTKNNRKEDLNYRTLASYVLLSSSSQRLAVIGNSHPTASLS